MRCLEYNRWVVSRVTKDPTEVSTLNAPERSRLFTAVRSWIRLGLHMSTIANVERKIRRVEGFDVRILHLRGADVRGDRAGMPQYPFRHAAADDITVEHWKETRFRPTFPGFEVDVLDGRGHSVQGNTKLSTVRGSY